MPRGGRLGCTRRGVGIALPARHGRQIKQHAHVVLLGPLKGTVDIVDQGNVDLRLALRAKGIPRHREAHGVQADCRDTAKVVFGDERLQMLPHTLVELGGTERRLQLRHIGGAGGSKERGRDPRLGKKPSRKVDAANSLEHTRSILIAHTARTVVSKSIADAPHARERRHRRSFRKRNFSLDPTDVFGIFNKLFLRQPRSDSSVGRAED